MHPLHTSSLNRIKATGPYTIVLVSLLVVLFVRYMNFNWVSGITNNYLAVHVILEFVGILVSFAIFTVGWATYQNARDSDILVLAVASFAVGALDLGHALTFTGMPEFFGVSGPNKAINFWFASRWIGSAAFLYVALARPRFTRFVWLQWVLLGLAAIWVSLCFWVILFHLDLMPVFFIEGQGLTPAKILIEWSLVAISCTAGVLLSIDAERRENLNGRWMAAASFLYGMCGYFFTIYIDFDDVYNFMGHIFKAISFVMLYRAVFWECVSRPYERVQELANEAKASNLSKSRFLANVSHEFRTPLGVISGFGDLLLTSESLQPNEKNWLQTMVRNSKQLSLLIDDLLDLAKAETDKIEVVLSQFDLATLVSQIVEGLEMQAKSGVFLKVENKMAGQTMVVSDELRLRQILINIIGNAIKFTPKGQVIVKIERTANSEIEILVEDSGIGIEVDDVGRLFKPFSQVSNPNNRRFGGTGLGLMLSRKLAELLGGRLYLKWSKPGSGSCFSITFHDHILEQDTLLAKDHAPLGTTAPPSFAGKKILIAEDSKDNQILLKAYLKPTQLEITFADNGRIALEMAQKENFELILMDIQMPEMDGFEATQQLRQKGWEGSIIALTAHALQPERDRAMKNGFNDYLVKPIKKEKLWFAISHHISS